MRQRGRIALVVTIVLLVLFGVGHIGEADVLIGLPEKTQEHSQWCWAGTSQAILAYYGISVEQCVIANWAWSRSDCCGDSVYNSSSACNQSNYMYGSTSSGSLQDILDNWGVDSTSLAAYLSKNNIVAQIDSNRPFVMRFGWTSGGGHFLDGYGYDQGADYVDYMDPLPGNGYTRSTYDWVVNAADHRWTHTLQITSSATGVVTVTKSGTGQGTVTSLPAGIDCGTVCSSGFAVGSSVALTATASGGSFFSSWSGCDTVVGNVCHVTASGNRSVTASFTENPILTVTKSGTGDGTVTGSPAGIDCGSTCSAAYTQGTSVKLTAKAVSGSTFSGWTGCDSSSGASCTVAMSASRSVIAIFAGPPPKISFSPSSINFSSVKNGGTLSRTLTVKNTGKGSLSVGTVSIGGTYASEFSVLSNCSVVASGGSCTIVVNFIPVSFGSKTAILTVPSNDSKKPSGTISLKGVCPAPKISASPGSVNLGAVTVGLKATKVIAVRNSALSDLVIASITASGDGSFSQTNNCGTIPNKGTCAINVTFTPGTAGSQTGSVVILSNDPSKRTVTVKLSGKGK